MADKNSHTAKSGRDLESLPFELVMESLKYLDNYKDLLNAMCASRLVHAVFQRASNMILSQIAHNNLEPESLQMALVAFYCTTDRLPFLPDGHRDRVQLIAQGCPEFQFPFKLPFPKQQPDIIDFFHLVKMIRSVTEMMIAKSGAHMKELLNANTDWPPSNHTASEPAVPLSVKERCRLEKKLYQYEFLARSLDFKEDGHLKSDKSSFQWRIWFLESIGIVEYLQLLTVEYWVLEGYQAWELEYETTLFDNVARAAAESKVRFTRSDDSSPAIGIDEPVVDVEPMAWSTWGESHKYTSILPDLHPRGEHQRLLSILQTYGLGLYKVLLESPPARRHNLMIRCHKLVRRMSCSAYSADAFSGYFLLLSPSNYHAMNFAEWETRVDTEGANFPNAYTKTWAQILHDPARTSPLCGSVRTYAMNTGWWFWDDAHLARVQFGRHSAACGNCGISFDDILFEGCQHRTICSHFVYPADLDTWMPIISMPLSRDEYVIPVREWERLNRMYGGFLDDTSVTASSDDNDDNVY